MCIFVNKIAACLNVTGMREDQNPSHKRPEASGVAADLQKMVGAQPPPPAAFGNGDGTSGAMCIFVNKIAACHDVTGIREVKIRGINVPKAAL